MMIDKHSLSLQDTVQPGMAEFTTIEMENYLWDDNLLPVEVVETNANVICTIWLQKLPVQNVSAIYKRGMLTLRVTTGSQASNAVTYEREINLDTAVTSDAADVIFSGKIATIALQKAKPNMAQRFFNSIDAALHPHRSTSLLHVKTN